MFVCARYIFDVSRANEQLRSYVVHTATLNDRFHMIAAAIYIMLDLIDIPDSQLE